MESSILKQASRFLREQRKNKRWRKVVAGLAVLVAAGTVAALVMPGQAQTHQVKVLDCGFEAHEHTEDCYMERTLAGGGTEKVLVCGKADYVLHVHNDDCYDALTGELACGLPEITTDHVHTDECYEEERVLVCGLEEGQAVTEGQPEGDDEAQAEAVDPTDGEEPQASEDEGTPVSGGDAEAEQGSDRPEGTGEESQAPEEESQAVHVHTDECYRTVRRLVCGELEPHEHTQECYGRLEEQEYYGALSEEEIELLLARNERNVPGEGIVLEEGEILLCELPELGTHVHSSEDGCFRIEEMTEEEIAALRGEDAESAETAETDGTEETAGTEEMEDVEEADGTEEVPADEESDGTMEESAEASDENIDDGDVSEDDEKDDVSGGDLEEETKDAGEEDVEGLEDGDADGLTGIDVSGGDLENGSLEKVYQDEEVRVVVSYGPEAEIPEEAELRVEKVNVEVVEEEVPSEDALSEDAAAEAAALEGPSVEDPEEFGSEDASEGESGESDDAQESAGVPILSYDEMTGAPIINEELLNEMAPKGILSNGMTIDEAIEKHIGINNTSRTKTVASYNIGLYVDGEEVEPAEGSIVTVSVTFLTDLFQDSNNMDVEHYGKEGEERDVQYSQEDGYTRDAEGHVVVTFQTGSFSTYQFMASNGSYMLMADEDSLPVVHVDASADDSDPTKVSSLWDAFNFVALDGKVILDTDYLVWDSTASLGDERITAKTVTLDLNGHRLTRYNDGYDPKAIISIGAGAKLILEDSAASQVVESENQVTLGRNLYGNLAAYNKDAYTLTYYVTKSEPNGGINGSTTETLWEHVATIEGAIDGSGLEKEIITVNGGSFEMRSGALVNSMDGAIYVNTTGEPTVILSGGYIAGNTNNRGGAVQADNGNTQLTINGDVVIAGNKSTGKPGGGAIYITGTGSLLTMDGGIISGNEARGNWVEGSGFTGDFGGGNISYGGGGIVSEEGNIVITKGYITNNVASVYSYFDGGGGILLKRIDRENTNDDQAFSCKISGMETYITGNYAKAGGGGINTGWSENRPADKGVTLYLGGGYICSNLAEGEEAGGVSVNHTSTAVLRAKEDQKIYINNNETKTTEHWGGGGLFVSNGSLLYLYSALLTDNNAGGFGGGLAGCSTGRIIGSIGDEGADDITQNGIAIFDNHAEGEHTSGQSSWKNADRLYAWGVPVFMESGYQDYFTAWISSFSDKMLGGGYERWSGSVDHKTFAVEEGSVVTSNFVAGLTAHPSDQHKNLARDKAKIYFNGNTSNTHGGGILSNGVLLVGEPTSALFPSAVGIEATKGFYDGAGNKLKMEKGKFVFGIYSVDEDGKETLYTTGINDDDPEGSILFSAPLTFDVNDFSGASAGATKEYVFRMREEIPEDPSVVMDGKVYEIIIKVVREDLRTIDYYNEAGTVVEKSIDIDRLVIKRVTVYLLDSEGKPTTKIYEKNDPASDEAEAGNIELQSLPGESNSKIFSNYKPDTKNVKVVKKWADGVDTDGLEVKVQLCQRKFGEDEWTSYESEDNPVTLNSGNKWTYEWSNLPSGTVDNTKEEKFVAYEYEVKEVEIRRNNDVVTEDFIPDYKVTGEHGEAVRCWVEVMPETGDTWDLEDGKKYLIVSGDYQWLMYDPHPESYSGSDEQGNQLGNGIWEYYTKDYKQSLDGLMKGGLTDPLKVGSRTYFHWLPELSESKEEVIPNEWTYTAKEHHTAFSEKDYSAKILVSNVRHDPLFIEDPPYKLKGTDRLDYASYVRYEKIEGQWYLVMQYRCTSIGDERDGRYVVYYDSKNEQFDVKPLSELESVKEKAVRLFKLINANSDATVVWTITNTPKEEVKYSLELTKVEDKEDSNAVKTYLKGAEFQMYRKEADGDETLLFFTKGPKGQYVYSEDNEGEEGDTLITGSNGKFVVEGLPEGEYVVRETKAPKGYGIPENNEQPVTLNEGTTKNQKLTIEFEDPKVETYELPETGGSGTTLYTMAGMALLALAGLMYKLKFRERRSGSSWI